MSVEADGSNFVTHDQLEAKLAEALGRAKEYTDAAENKLREEWTNAVRFEVGRVDRHLESQDDHLEKQDTKINWILGLIVSGLFVVVGGLVYILATIHP